MCLIIHRPEGAELDPGLLAAGLQDNPDGWGIMAADDGRIRVIKGMTPGPFHKALKKLGAAALTIHFRWATHGKRNLDNCHPFAFGEGRYALMHNGILDNVPDRDRDRSDTWHFVHEILEPMLAGNPALFGTDRLQATLEALIGSANKLAILRSDGASMLVNRARGIEHADLWLSNGHSLRRPAPARALTLSHLGDDGWGRHLVELDRDGFELAPAREATWTLDDLKDLQQYEIADLCQDDPDMVAGLIWDYLNG